ncbi:MAG: STAS/SEC14 domain-containing protein [Desulfobacterales bacterium]|nr:STAS/SEC14 domain-containing protein [Desulfobacterales bacterium]
MIEITLDQDTGIVTVTPSGPLTKQDFKHLAGEVDPYIEKTGKLNGLIILIESFPGWEDFAGLISHLKFVREHHKKIEKVAAVTDGKIVSIMPKIVDHFVNAKVKCFPYESYNEALSWVQSQD